MDWRNKIPTNRQIEARWAEFCEILGEATDDFIVPKLEELKNLHTYKASANDKRMRIGGLKTNFMQNDVTHVAEKLANQMSYQMITMKGTDLLWKIYARQLGFGLNDLHIEERRTDSPEDYSQEFFRHGGRFPTARLSLILSTRNERWLHQSVSDAGKLIFEYAKKTRPAHIVVERVVLASPVEETPIKSIISSCVESERICRISL